VLKEYLQYIQERYDYVKEHGHDKCETNSILWHFHNYEHGYKHCEGPSSNPYEIEHHGKIHIISTQYARGHGINKETQWFNFTEEIKPDWWKVETGIKISLDEVPEKFKKREDV